MWLSLTLAALFFFGLTGITQKVCTNNISFELSFLYFCLAMALVSLAVIIIVPLAWTNLTVGQIALITSGGLLNGLGAYTSFAALEKGGKASIVIPIINLFPLVTVVGAWLFLGEVLSLKQLCGLTLALFAVVLLSRETPAPRD